MPIVYASDAFLKLTGLWVAYLFDYTIMNLDLEIDPVIYARTIQLTDFFILIEIVFWF